jgi:transposase
MGKILPVPEFSRLSKRATEPLARLSLPSLKEPSHVIIDSSGLKVFGEREWLETKYGKQYQRKVWRKLHIGINDQGEIIAKELTYHLTDDRACVDSLLHQAGIEHINELLADGGYDSHKMYQSSETHQIKLIIPPPKHAVISSQSNPTLRDQTIDYIKKKGYWAWYHKNDYGRRNKVENTFYRLKTIFGRKLHSKDWNNQQAEAHLICCLLNKMTQAGMPKSVKAT